MIQTAIYKRFFAEVAQKMAEIHIEYCPVYSARTGGRSDMGTGGNAKNAMSSPGSSCGRPKKR